MNIQQFSTFSHERPQVNSIVFPLAWRSRYHRPLTGKNSILWSIPCRHLKRLTRPKNSCHMDQSLSATMLTWPQLGYSMIDVRSRENAFPSFGCPPWRPSYLPTIKWPWTSWHDPLKPPGQHAAPLITSQWGTLVRFKQFMILKRIHSRLEDIFGVGKIIIKQ